MSAKLDHVTYQVPYGTLSDRELSRQIAEFFSLLEMKDVPPDGEIEKGWTVRWYEDASGFQVHLVEPENNQIQPQQVDLALGHFCAVISREGFKEAIDSPLLEHYSGGTRCWVKGPLGLRAEVRPRPLTDFVLSAEEAQQLGERYLREFAAGSTLKSVRPSTQAQERILMKALAIYEERNEKYNDNWRRFGWRGCLFRLRERVERAWDHLWGYDLAAVPDPPDLDDLYDLINFAAFTIRAVEEGNRDGSWFN